MRRNLAWVRWAAVLALAAGAAACDSADGADAVDTGVGDLADVPRDAAPDTCGAACEDATADVPDVPPADVPPADVPPEVPADVPADEGDACGTACADVPPPDVGPAEPSCHEGTCAADPMNAPDPTKFGPFPVGVRRYTYVDPDNPNLDGTPRVLRTEIWYPAVEAARDMPRYAYDIKADATDEVREKYKDVELGTYYTESVWEPDVRVGERPWPLVIFSHGAFGIRYQSPYFTVQLASHGYVVMSADHQYNTLYEILMDGWDPATLVESAMRRPNDMLYLIDEAGRMNRDPESPFYGRLAPDVVGSTGHSFGGLTSYVIAGDPRVKCIVPMAPEASVVDIFAAEWGSVPMAELHVPTMMMGGMMDHTLSYETSMWAPWNEQNKPKWFLSIRRGGHYTFTDICRMNLAGVKDLWGDAEDAMEDGCDPVNNWDFNTAHDAINQYAISFLNYYLRGSTGSAQYMTSEAGAPWGDEITFYAEPE